MTIQQSITEIINTRKQDVVYNADLFHALLADLSPEQEKERRVLRKAIGNDILPELFSLHGSQTPSAKTRIRVSLEENGLSEKWIESIIAYFGETSKGKDNIASSNRTEKDYLDPVLFENQLFGAMNGNVQAKTYLSENFVRYKTAAEQGSVNAAYYLGALYDNGYGVDQDHIVAAYWYEIAAKHGNVSAQNRIESLNGLVLFDGLYQYKENGYSSYLRFFADGTVVGVSSVGTPEQVCKWLNQDFESHGTYVIADGNINLNIDGSEGRVTYSGKMINSTLLKLDIISHINGNRTFGCEYHFSKCSYSEGGYHSSDK